MTTVATEPSLLERVFAAARIGENDDWEFKSAKGGFPGNLWETYSAMANTAGGTIVLGASERDEQVHLDGLPQAQIEKHRKTLWASLNNRQIISHNLLSTDRVEPVQVDGGWLLVIRVPQAIRKQRPVYCGLNPFDGHTFKRRHDGDHRCSDDEVRRMFADADDTPADARILDGFSAADLDLSSVQGFRNRFASTRPSHVWINLPDDELLEKIGATRVDRETGKHGVTLAGMLMLGKYQAIISPGAAPSYFVDFRDYRGRTSVNERWVDRLFSDGTWEANLFQFYTRCLPKLYADIKTPFALKAGQRIYESPVHVALQEALVNALIHTDYSVSGGIVIERHDDSYQFSNPGTLLVSEEQLRRGGTSECRNKNLQRMFINIGGGDQAGSGFERIQAGWKSQHWRTPRLTAQDQPDRIRLDMPMVSLIPEVILDDLRQRFGKRKVSGLSQGEVLALSTASLEGNVTNTRMRDHVKDHPSDITKMLRSLVEKGFLKAENQRRWTRYRLAPQRGGGDLFEEGDKAPPPITKAEEDQLLLIAEPVRGKRPSRDQLENVVLELCKVRYLTFREIARFVGRKNPEKFRETVLAKLVAEGRLVRLYPEKAGHRRQAYRTAGTV